MLCEDCKKREATVHITQIVNNHKLEKHVCSQCASQYGQTMVTPISVQDFLKGMFSEGLGRSYTGSERIACEACGMTYEDFNRSGKFNCSECYSSLGRQVDPVLRRIHGATAHTGKIPHRSGKSLEQEQQVKKLRSQLDVAVKQEEYEEAARIRDQIRVLEKELEQQRHAEGGEK